MRNQSPTIVLTGGGSGGHITPLLSLAHELKQRSPGCRIIYIGHKGDNLGTIRDSNSVLDDTAFINAGKLRRYHGNFAKGIFEPRTMALNARDLLRLPGSLLMSFRILNSFKPDAVFSKGGFVAVPVCAAAKLLGIPILTHDSDVSPGLANRLIGRWAKVHATGMPTHFYNYPKDTMVYVGIPLDARIKRGTPRLQRQAKNNLRVPSDSRLVLVSGGGNGSLRINQLTLSLAKELLAEDRLVYIIHLAGPAHKKDVEKEYEKFPHAARRRVKVYGYSNEFYQLAAAADLVITRAGATTLAELAASGKACVVIPAPFLAGGHQLKNAEELSERDAAVIVDDDVQPNELLSIIRNLLDDAARRSTLANNLYASVQTNAAGKLAELILDLVNGAGQH